MSTFSIDILTVKIKKYETISLEIRMSSVVNVRNIDTKFQFKRNFQKFKQNLMFKVSLAI